MMSRFATSPVVAVLLLLFTVVCLLSNCNAKATDTQKRVVFIPLDERFATRSCFLNIAKLTPFEIATPDTATISLLKRSADLKAMHAWLDVQIPKADYLVISAEMYLYGGLIQSRISNDSLGAIEERLHRLIAYKEANPNLKIYISTVIMRIPAYNGDFEEPTYWATYGRQLYEYSFYLDRYEVLRNPSDLDTVRQLEQQIPRDILTQFLWRRERNKKITETIIVKQHEFQLAGKGRLFEQIYITLDDNAEYGLNKKEERELRELVSKLRLDADFNIYPGADEVQLVVLSKVAVDETGVTPKFKIVYRNPATKDYIPNYEGQPLSKTVEAQIHGAGGLVIDDNNADAGEEVIHLLVNNFDEKKQQEAPPASNQRPANYEPFVPYLRNISNHDAIGFADSRYSNGGDIYFMKWLNDQRLDMAYFAYAGWNTNGNTLGTAISNSVLLHLFKQSLPNKYFNTLRILEDVHYQAFIRQDLISYVTSTGGNPNNLAPKLPVYENFVYEAMLKPMQELTLAYSLPFTLEQPYFPWNRTFEIGLNMKF